MALTPEDVVTKEFGRPKSFGRSGYDEGQVDDFLDDIVVELRRLNAENEKLTSQLEDCRRSKGQTGREGGGENGRSGAATVPGLTPVPAAGGSASAASGGADPAEVKAAQQKLAALKSETTRAQEAARAAKDAQKQAETRLAAIRTEIETAQRDAKGRPAGARGDSRVSPAAAGAAGAGAGAAAGATAAAPSGKSDDEKASSVILLAQRLHDEHVAEGKKTKERLIGEGESYRDRVVGEANAKRDELIGIGQKKHDELIRTGQSEHERLVKEATDKATTLVRDAEGQKSTIIGQLTTERDRLTGDIEGLRGFEKDYRGKLKSLLTDQMKFLDGTTFEGGEAGKSNTKESQPSGNPG